MSDEGIWYVRWRDLIWYVLIWYVRWRDLIWYVRWRNLICPTDGGI